MTRRTLSLSAVALTVGLLGGCAHAGRPVAEADPSMTPAQQANFYAAQRRTAVADALRVLRRSTNWRSPQPVSDEAFAGLYDTYRVVGVENRTVPGGLVNGQPVVEHIKHFDHQWRPTRVAWADLAEAKPDHQGRYALGLIETNEGERPVYGHLVVPPAVDYRQDQTDGFVAAFESADDRDQFLDGVATITRLSRRIDELRPPADTPAPVADLTPAP